MHAENWRVIMGANESYAWAVAPASDAEVAGLVGVGGGEQPGRRYIGVKALMLAILDDAIRAYLGPVGPSREEAALWMADGRSNWVFSFPVVCETLGLEPAAVRQAVRRMKIRPAAVSKFGSMRSRPNARRYAGLRMGTPRSGIVARP
jgi:hypothetical protein